MLSPENAIDAIKVFTGAGAAVFLAWIKGRIDSKKNKSDARGLFTTQLINRLRDVEMQLDSERIHYEKLLEDQAARYQKLVDALTMRVDALELERDK